MHHFLASSILNLLCVPGQDFGMFHQVGYRLSEDRLHIECSAKRMYKSTGSKKGEEDHYHESEARPSISDSVGLNYEESAELEPLLPPVRSRPAKRGMKRGESFLYEVADSLPLAPAPDFMVTSPSC